MPPPEDPWPSIQRDPSVHSVATRRFDYLRLVHVLASRRDAVQFRHSRMAHRSISLLPVPAESFCRVRGPAGDHGPDGGITASCVADFSTPRDMPQCYHCAPPNPMSDDHDVTPHRQWRPTEPGQSSSNMPSTTFIALFHSRFIMDFIFLLLEGAGFPQSVWKRRSTGSTSSPGMWTRSMARSVS